MLADVWVHDRLFRLFAICTALSRICSRWCSVTMSPAAILLISRRQYVTVTRTYGFHIGVRPGMFCFIVLYLSCKPSFESTLKSYRDSLRHFLKRGTPLSSVTPARTRGTTNNYLVQLTRCEITNRGEDEFDLASTGLK